MGGTTAIVLVALIIALMLVLVIALVVWGGVRALEVRHEAKRSAFVPPAIAHTSQAAPTVNGVSRHDMFEQGNR